MNKSKLKYFISFTIIAAIFYFIVMDVLLCLLPPIARDAIIHHLAVPKFWINHGGFYEMPWALHSYYPMNLDMLYLIPLYFGNDIIPNFIHLSFGIGTSVMIYCYLKWRINYIAGLLGFLLFLSTPVISKLSTVAYVDLGLVFFIAASAFSFIRWRDGKYKEYRWLVISSVAMGLALGTKYNALVAWFFMTLAIVFINSRDSGESGKPVGYGLIFFIISLAVFSPWLIKNAILTGNPLYPLFPGIFEGHASAGGNASAAGTAVVHGNAPAGMFRMREMMYGESLWETLLIPLRIFFQGQDDVPRYFDGVLNPILLIFVPFAFIRKNWKMEKLYFLFFSIFIIMVNFFMEQIRIRYILPVIPFLVILSVAGLVNAYEWLAERKSLWRQMGIGGLAIITIMLLSLNVMYLQKYFVNIDPLKYILKKESRDDFIARHDSSYPAMMYINKHTPEDSVIRLLFLAGRGYHLDRPYSDDRWMGMGVIRTMIGYADNEKSFRDYIISLHCTHFFVRNDLFENFLKDNFKSEDIEKLKRQMNSVFKKIYDDQKYVIFSVIRQ